MDGHDHNHEHHAHHSHPSINATTAPSISTSAVTQAIVEAATDPMIHSGHGHGDHGAHDAGAAQIHTGHHDHHSGHAHSDGGGDAHSGGEHSMKMWFHGGYTEVILFDWWRIDSCAGLIFSCVLVFVMAAAYEALKWFRVYFQLWANSQHARRLAMGAKQQHAHHHPTAPSISFKGLTSSASSRAAEEALIQEHSPGSDRREATEQRRQQLSENQEPEQVYAPTVTPALGDQSRKFPSIGRLLDSVPFASATVSPSVSRWIESALYCVQLALAYWLMLIAMTYNIYLTAMVVLGAGFGHWLFAAVNGKSSNCSSSTAKACGNNNGQVACKGVVDDFVSDACH